jgi:integrase
MPTKVKFTDKFLAALKPAPAGERLMIWDTQVKGLGIRVTDKGAVTFFVTRRLKGSTAVRIVLGRYGEISLADARRSGQEKLIELGRGLDPRTVQNAQAGSPLLFSHIAEGYIAHIEKGSNERTATSIKRRVNRELVSRWGKRPVASIKIADVALMVNEVNEKSGPQAARVTLAYAKSMFSWAIGYHCKEWLALDRTGFEYNPARDVKPGKYLNLADPRDRILNAHELALVWQAAGDVYPFGPYLRLLILFGNRRTELAEARWSEFDFNLKSWLIPATRMKGGLAHMIPLAPLALEILKKLPRNERSDLLFSFSRGKPMNHFGWAKRAVDKKIAELNGGVPIPHWTYHDLRRSMRSGLSDLAIPQEVAELCIAHKRRGIVGVYDRSDRWLERQAAMAKWANKVAEISTRDRTESETVPFKRSA